MKNIYSISEFFAIVFDLLLTKIFYNKARLVRRPVYIRGKKGMKYKKGLTTGHGCRFDLTGKKVTLRIGENCSIGDYVHIVAYENVIIGNNCLMASKVFISDTNHGEYIKKEDLEIPPNRRDLISKPVSIGDNVWIGENVCILAGINIGNSVVVGANAVVKCDVPDNCIVGGVPARIIKEFI